MSKLTTAIVARWCAQRVRSSAQTNSERHKTPPKIRALKKRRRPICSARKIGLHFDQSPPHLLLASISPIHPGPRRIIITPVGEVRFGALQFPPGGQRETRFSTASCPGRSPTSTYTEAFTWLLGYQASYASGQEGILITWRLAPPVAPMYGVLRNNIIT